MLVPRCCCSSAAAAFHFARCCLLRYRLLLLLLLLLLLCRFAVRLSSTAVCGACCGFVALLYTASASNLQGIGERTKLVRGIVREVAGWAPYEKRIMEILKVRTNAKGDNAVATKQ